jgi:hypothetical protein
MSEVRKRIQAVCVDPARAREVWRTVCLWIGEAIDRGGNVTDYATLEKDVFEGRALLWLAFDKPGYQVKAAAVTSLASAGAKKFCTIVACGGRHLHNWKDCIDAIEDYARAEGCVSVVIQGRRGWQRVLADYEPIAILMERRL